MIGIGIGTKMIGLAWSCMKCRYGCRAAGHVQGMLPEEVCMWVERLTPHAGSLGLGMVGSNIYDKVGPPRVV